MSSDPNAIEYEPKSDDELSTQLSIGPAQGNRKREITFECSDLFDNKKHVTKLITITREDGVLKTVTLGDDDTTNNNVCDGMTAEETPTWKLCATDSDPPVYNCFVRQCQEGLYTREVSDHATETDCNDAKEALESGGEPTVETKVYALTTAPGNRVRDSNKNAICTVGINTKVVKILKYDNWRNEIAYWSVYFEESNDIESSSSHTDGGIEETCTTNKATLDSPGYISDNILSDIVP